MGVGMQEERATAADEPGTLDPEKGGAGEVGREYFPLAVEGEITDRGKIVKVGVPCQCRIRLVPRLPQFRILHLQLDLVDLQFLDEPLSFPLGGRGRWFNLLRPQPFDGVAA